MNILRLTYEETRTVVLALEVAAEQYLKDAVKIAEAMPNSAAGDRIVLQFNVQNQAADELRHKIERGENITRD